jgi:hypothetical protein
MMGGTMIRTLALVVAFSLTLCDPLGAAAQTPPALESPDRVAIGGRDVSRYRAMYGEPEFRGLDDEQSRPWPMRQAIRTIGRLERILERGKSGQGTAGQTSGRGREWDSEVAPYEICGGQICLAIVPVQELQDVLVGRASGWVHENIEVIGAIDELNAMGPVVFQVWSIFEAPDRVARKPGSKGSSLERLVRYPKGAEGSVVTVRGTFRGANLFEDLAPESRRRASDWVLLDGPFSIWVTGKAPKGKGFSLDPQSRSDAVHRLEVAGTVETEGGYIYLRAKTVQLLGRAKDE